MRKYLNFLFELLLIFSDTLAVSITKSNSNNKIKILLVRLDAIGDFVLWLDAAQTVREIYPPELYHITLLGNQIWSDFAEKIDYFDEVWELNRKKFLHNPLYRIKLMSKIKREGFFLAVQPTISREFIFGDAVVRASGATERIGSVGDNANIDWLRKRISDQWYTRLIPLNGHEAIELERNAEFAREMGARTFTASIPKIKISNFSVHKNRNVNMQIARYFVLFPGASSPIKSWPIEKFIQVIEKIFNTTGIVCVVCGGKNELKYVDHFINNSFKSINIINMTTLPELVYIISRAEFIISNDTCATHIAAAVSRPSVCILGGGHFGRFLPYTINGKFNRHNSIAIYGNMDCFECNWNCKYDPGQHQCAPCIDRVTVDQVFEAVINIMNQPIS